MLYEVITEEWPDHGKRVADPDGRGRAALPYLRQSSRAAILTVTSVSVKQPIDNLILSNSLRMGVSYNFV